ncbi:MAG TPA: fused MFS/spermidine synthase, partial [Pseudomonadales bacterium]
ETLMRWVFERIEDPRYGSLVAAAALFTLPTVVLGMLSPYAVRLVVRDTQHSGRVAGTLYFVSTLGSAAGTLATSFYLVLWFEINTILNLLTACLVACAAVGYVAGRR